jgi:hypothetical protein
MYQSSRAPAAILGLPPQLLSEIGQCADDDDLLSVCQLLFHLEGALTEIFLREQELLSTGHHLYF